MEFWDDLESVNNDVAKGLGKEAQLNESVEIHVLPMEEYEGVSPYGGEMEAIDMKVMASLSEDPMVKDIRHGDSLNVPEVINGILTDMYYRIRGIQPDGDGMVLLLLKKETVS